jgi:hypothetical protein
MILTELEREKSKVWNRTCPTCEEPMKRKGSFGRNYYKCPKCKIKTNGNGKVIYNPASMPDDLVMKKEFITNWRNIIAQEKFIKDLKQNKYNTKRYYEWGGIVLDLEKYGMDGKELPGLKEQEEKAEKERKEEKEFDERAM